VGLLDKQIPRGTPSGKHAFQFILFLNIPDSDHIENYQTLNTYPILALPSATNQHDRQADLHPPVLRGPGMFVSSRKIQDLKLIFLRLPDSLSLLSVP
jgi:hypothetical protein